MTFKGSSPRRFGLPPGYEGTSMAAPHVAATAALIIASRVLGRHPTPAQIAARTARDRTKLGGGGDERLYGAGLVNAAAATAPGGPGAVATVAPERRARKTQACREGCLTRRLARGSSRLSSRSQTERRPVLIWRRLTRPSYAVPPVAYADKANHVVVFAVAGREFGAAFVVDHDCCVAFGPLAVHE